MHQATMSGDLVTRASHVRTEFGYVLEPDCSCDKPQHYLYSSLKMLWFPQVAGTSGKVQQTADEDAEGISSDAHGQAILEALGLERRNEVSQTFFLDEHPHLSLPGVTVLAIAADAMPVLVPSITQTSHHAWTFRAYISHYDQFAPHLAKPPNIFHREAQDHTERHLLPSHSTANARLCQSDKVTQAVAASQAFASQRSTSSHI